MNAPDPRIIERLKKILALARQGVGGEKQNAQRMLDSLLAKHGMTLADLDGSVQVREDCEFSPKNAAEMTLLVQCVASVVLDWDFMVWSAKRGKKRWISLTKAECLEVRLMFDIHRKALAKHLAKQAKVALAAYIHTNGIYSKKSADNEQEDAKESAADMEEIMAILSMMQSMKPTPVHKAITARAA